MLMFGPMVASASAGGLVAALMMMGSEERFMRASCVVFLYYLVQTPRVIAESVDKRADLFRFVFAACSPLLYVALGAVPSVLSGFRFLVYATGLLYCLIEAVVVIDAAERISTKVNNIVSSVDVSETLSLLMKVLALTASCASYAGAGVLWYQFFNEGFPQTAPYVAGMVAILALTIMSLVDDHGVITESAFTSLLVTYCLWSSRNPVLGSLKNLAMAVVGSGSFVRPALSIGIGVVVIAYFAILFLESKPDPDRFEHLSEFVFDIEPTVKCALVLLSSNLLSTMAGYHADSWLYFRFAEVIATPLLYGLMLYRKHEMDSAEY
ncbi:Uncharacterized protein PBTT_05823 [Plasmodiophora brassicae]